MLSRIVPNKSSFETFNEINERRDRLPRSSELSSFLTWKSNLHNWIVNRTVSMRPFPIVGLILAMTVYLRVWNPHCIKAGFTVLVSCSDELVVHSGPQRQVAKHASWLFYCLSLLRNNSIATILKVFLSFNSIQGMVVGVLPHMITERRHLSR